MGQMPHMQFYIGDYIRDTRALTLEEKGAWTECLWQMFDNNGMLQGTWEEIGLRIGCDKAKAEQVISKLAAKNICDLQIKKDTNPHTVIIVNRRMYNRFKLSQTRSISGSQKGKNKPSKIEANLKHLSDNDIDNGSDIDIDIESGIVFPFQSDSFRLKWSEWKAYRTEIKKPYKTAKAEQRALSQLEGFDEKFAIELINTSMNNGWQGLVFQETKQKYDGKKTSTRRGYTDEELFAPFNEE